MLLAGILAGSLVALWIPGSVPYLTPLGDVFLNLLFVSVIPLLFFSLASSVANISENSRLGNILGVMAFVFLGTIVIASLLTIFGLWVFPVTDIAVSPDSMATVMNDENGNWADRFVQFVSVSEFGELLSRQHILAFVIFSFFVGMQVRYSSGLGETIVIYLISSNEVMNRLLILIIKFGPVGLGVYFSYQVFKLGPELIRYHTKPFPFY